MSAGWLRSILELVPVRRRDAGTLCCSSFSPTGGKMVTYYTTHQEATDGRILAVWTYCIDYLEICCLGLSVLIEARCRVLLITLMEAQRWQHCFHFGPGWNISTVTWGFQVWTDVLGNHILGQSWQMLAIPLTLLPSTDIDILDFCQEKMHGPQMMNPLYDPPRCFLL